MVLYNTIGSHYNAVQYDEILYIAQGQKNIRNKDPFQYKDAVLSVKEIPLWSEDGLHNRIPYTGKMFILVKIGKIFILNCPPHF